MHLSFRRMATLSLILTAGSVFGACRNNEGMPSTDTTEVSPAMKRDMSATRKAPDSTTGISTPVMRGTVAGDTAARSDATENPARMPRDTGSPPRP